MVLMTPSTNRVGHAHPTLRQFHHRIYLKCTFCGAARLGFCIITGYLHAMLTTRYPSPTWAPDAVQQAKPFAAYVAFSHVHAPNFASAAFCNSSTRGPVGYTQAVWD